MGVINASLIRLFFLAFICSVWAIAPLGPAEAQSKKAVVKKGKAPKRGSEMRYPPGPPPPPPPEQRYPPMPPEKCVFGNSEFKDLHQQIAKPPARDNAFLMAFHHEEYGSLDCSNCKKNHLKNSLEDLKKISSTEVIRRECVIAALSRSVPEVSNHICQTDSGEPTNVGKDNNICITRGIIDYTHWGINKTFACLSAASGEKFDARFFFKKLNNESGARFFIGNNNGKGIGQLTSFGSGEMVGPPYGGAKILAAVAKSEDPNCAPFKEILSKEFQFGHKTRQCAIGVESGDWEGSDCGKYENGVARVCQLVGAGQGFGRNLLFAGTLYLMYKQDVKNLLAEQPRLLASNDVVAHLTLIRYSRFGVPGARAGASAIRGMSPTDAVKVLENNPYISETNRSMRDVLAQLDESLKEGNRSDLKGDPCVE